MRIAKLLCLVSLGLVATAAISTGASAAQMPGGSWSGSCTGASMSGHMLSAICTDMSGSQKPTAINVTNCAHPVAVANINGRLRCESGLPTGSWRSSCERGWMNGPVVSAACRTIAGTWSDTFLNTNTCMGHPVALANINGQLQCAPGDLPGGSWAASCKQANVNGKFLTALCATTTGNFIPARINLRKCNSTITNLDGALVCDN